MKFIPKDDSSRTAISFRPSMLSIIATYSAPVPLHGRELTAGWQAYMNQGLQTGAAYAGTGASGEGSFDDLNAQTADAFSALNHQGEPAAAAASPSAASASTAASPASTIGTDVTSAVATPIVSSTDAFTAGIISVVDSLTAALGSPAASSAAPASAAAPASPSSSGAASAPHFAGWQAYMNQGIATGLQYANAGAGVAAGTTDPATGFNDLNAATADSFDALNHGAPLAEQDGGERRKLAAAAPEEKVWTGAWSDHHVEAGGKETTSPLGAANVGTSSLEHAATTGFAHGASHVIGANTHGATDDHAANSDILSTDKYLGTPGHQNDWTQYLPVVPGNNDGGYLGGEVVQDESQVSGYVGGSYYPYPAAPAEYATVGPIYAGKYTAAGLETVAGWATGADFNEEGMPEGTANRFLELDTQLLDDFDKLNRGGSVLGR